jgi:hypothetical protein
VITQEGATGDSLTAAKPIEIACGPVAFPDGSDLTTETSPTVFGFLLQRGAAGSGEVWDAQAKTWIPDADGPAPEPLFYRDGSWRGVLVAVGQQDATGAEKIASDPATGLPRYSVRCVFAGEDGSGTEHDGESGSSDAVTVLPPGHDAKAGLRLDPEKPPEATKVEMFVAGDGGDVGNVTLERGGTGGSVTVAAGGATISIAATGAVQITPGAGQAITISGSLAVSDGITVGGREVVTI